MSYIKCYSCIMAYHDPNFLRMKYPAIEATPTVIVVAMKVFFKVQSGMN